MEYPHYCLVLLSFPSRRSSDLRFCFSLSVIATIATWKPLALKRERLWFAQSSADCASSAASRKCSFPITRSEEHTSELQSRGHLVCRLMIRKNKNHEQST